MSGPLNEVHQLYTRKEEEFRRTMEQFKSENKAALLHQRDKPGAALNTNTEQVLAERAAQYELFQVSRLATSHHV